MILTDETGNSYLLLGKHTSNDNTFLVERIPTAEKSNAEIAKELHDSELIDRMPLSELRATARLLDAVDAKIAPVQEQAKAAKDQAEAAMERINDVWKYLKSQSAK